MQGQMLEVDELGSQLSIEIDCPVHYPAFGKHLFECRCGVVFPVYLVKSLNWELIRRKHEEERRYSLV
jgi:hypothetical protein